MPADLTTYGDSRTAGLEGDIANQEVRNIISVVCEEATGIPFGYAVVQGTADDQGLLPVDANSVFLGLAVRKAAKNRSSNSVDSYEDEDEMAVMTKGVIWATCEDGCSPGDDVYWRHTAAGAEEKGELRTDADTADAVQIPNAKWITTAAADGLAMIRLG